ncbi:RIP metalloprotease RseP [Luteibaculum oceani]|uniref:Zinc metalloprotease n=1 Tax=Luteibaculum oceani TaxID=1294296 RepID=A0A5C6VKP4_9FLAO|nr:RIP metalloprotease RseP [Luteibaculum oceani]TXC85274.1 RIP metalloprotease RseP [Luteibaculum oceani]
MEFSVILIKAAQLILSLSILIVLHELGHFIPARLFGTRVEKFYLFFDWKFSLLKFKKGDTEYGIGWIPLGGYVKISGMIDESMDKEQLAKDPEPYEFRSKPAWQRLIIMLGGVTVNLILGFFIYAMVLFAYGSDKLPLKSAEFGMEYAELLQEQGFVNGDKLVKIGDKEVKYFSEVNAALIIEDYNSVTVERNGTIQEIEIAPDFKEKLIEANPRSPVLQPRIPFLIDSVLPNSLASKAGLLKGDRIVKADSDSALMLMEVRERIGKAKGDTILLGVISSSGDYRQLKVTPDTSGTIGVFMAPPTRFLEVEKVNYSFAEAIPAGFNLCISTLTNYVRSLKLLGTKAGASSIGGFGSIGNLFPATWDWESFWRLTAFISIVLAFMNVLPIPALDGGHVIFLLWEIISGKKPPQKVLEVAQTIGMVLLLALLLFANINDIIKGIFG